MSEKTTLEGLVCQNMTQEAIDELKSLIERLASEHLNNLNALSGRYSANKKADVDGVVSQDMTFMESNRIRSAFLSILSDIREEIQSKINFFKPIPRAIKERDTLRDFIDTVLSRKYSDINAFSEGMSFIYFSAKERHSDQDVMIMVLKSSDIEEIKKNSQLSRISQLKHRNIIQLLDVNFQNYPYYIITEFVSGVSLKKLLANTGAFPLHHAKHLLLIIGDVMDYLRHKKFKHSGIRPSKIIIDQELEPEISPFDILRASESKRLVNTFMEDSYYFAPERLHDSGQDITTESTDKANQFCLAALAYEVLTGEKLFAGANVSEILLTRHRFFTDPEYRKAKLSDPRLPSRMATIIKKMLNWDPAKRYDDLPSALREISKIRVDLDENEEKVFSSYKRCLSYTENFPRLFYDKLFAQKGMEKYIPQDKKEWESLYQKFHIAVHLVFDVENAVNFLERVTRLSQTRNNTVDQYAMLMDVFIETVAQHDPRWATRSGTAEAWNQIRKRLLESLAAYLPETEPDTGKPENEAPEAIATALTSEETPAASDPGGPDLTYPGSPEEQNGSNPVADEGKKGEPDYDPEKA
ncbi:MAG TPA: protein kinase [Saprospiraceae bacterium]|nr:protein kinase [Saprospiraceae bacterium]